MSEEKDDESSAADASVSVAANSGGGRNLQLQKKRPRLTRGGPPKAPRRSPLGPTPLAQGAPENGGRAGSKPLTRAAPGARLHWGPRQSASGRLESLHTVTGALIAMPKVASVYNHFWRLAKFPSCRQWAVDEYPSAGSLHAATAIVARRKRGRMLEEISAGSAMALGKRKQAVADNQRRGVAKAALFKT